jgi:hypothetical protein
VAQKFSSPQNRLDGVEDEDNFSKPPDVDDIVGNRVRLCSGLPFSALFRHESELIIDIIC